MARLLIKSAGFENRVIDLRLGINRFGRAPGNDFRIEHLAVSSRHCEIDLSDGKVRVKDCGSTNGTFLDGEPVEEATLAVGQILCLGEVEFLVESTEVNIAIPEFETPRPVPPIALKDGSLLCRKHPQAVVTYHCTHCGEMMCTVCVHRLRRRGGRMLKLCPLCSYPVAPLTDRKAKKWSFLGFLQRTVKLPFLRASKPE